MIKCRVALRRLRCLDREGVKIWWQGPGLSKDVLLAGAQPVQRQGKRHPVMEAIKIPVAAMMGCGKGRLKEPHKLDRWGVPDWGSNSHSNISSVLAPSQKK